MPINVGENKVTKIAVGDKVIMEAKQNNWVELELPDKATPGSGNILFQDMGDGTARIFGGFEVTAANATDLDYTFEIPSEYSIVSVENSGISYGTAAAASPDLGAVNIGSNPHEVKLTGSDLGYAAHVQLGYASGSKFSNPYIKLAIKNN